MRPFGGVNAGRVLEAVKRGAGKLRRTHEVWRGLDTSQRPMFIYHACVLVATRRRSSRLTTAVWLALVYRLT
jgi:hypothetical protein